VIIDVNVLVSLKHCVFYFIFTVRIKPPFSLILGLKRHDEGWGKVGDAYRVTLSSLQEF